MTCFHLFSSSSSPHTGHGPLLVTSYKWIFARLTHVWLSIVPLLEFIVCVSMSTVFITQWVCVIWLVTGLLK